MKGLRIRKLELELDNQKIMTLNDIKYTDGLKRMDEFVKKKLGR